MAIIFHRKQHTIKQISPVPPWYLLDNILYISVLKYKEESINFWCWGWIWVVHERYIKVYQKECMNTLMICPGMVCKLVVSCVVFSRWCVLQLSNVLFLCLDLNGFKEAISQQESEEENGWGLIVFGVTMAASIYELWSDLKSAQANLAMKSRQNPKISTWKSLPK